MKKKRLPGMNFHMGPTTPKHPDAVVADVIRSYHSGKETQPEIAARVGIPVTLVAWWCNGTTRRKVWLRVINDIKTNKIKA